jgi:hypothetical protein
MWFGIMIGTAPSATGIRSVAAESRHGYLLNGSMPRRAGPLRARGLGSRSERHAEAWHPAGSLPIEWGAEAFVQQGAVGRALPPAGRAGPAVSIGLSPGSFNFFIHSAHSESTTMRAMRKALETRSREPSNRAAPNCSGQRHYRTRSGELGIYDLRSR